ncbi:CWC2 Pre-mRNA-splicing factor CWC2 [Candida maltosa Xu316]|uniref:Pre-mRNA-splicing factor CWC2 n=1 Tax=Candida maltosa (strain Xu316) TaxID=1245528 RepID=M3HQH4_CANMX|nr:hypothetical protein G210_5431 [Candida maltosa Xu316]
MASSNSTSLTRPARLQINPSTLTDSAKPVEVGSPSFNIWWTKSTSSSSGKEKSKYRVNIAKDEGYTKATSGSPICLFFSRGCCYLGQKCKYFHRLPSPEIDHFKPTQDCFGRDKTANYRDDMDGVGSFNKVNCTLYISGFYMRNNIEDLIVRNVMEFGEVVKTRVLKEKSCAFITLKTENQAQFVKEALNCQSLQEGSNEVLKVRWANEDKNPEAQKLEKRRMEELAMDTVRQLLESENSLKRQKVANDDGNSTKEDDKDDEKENNVVETSGEKETTNGTPKNGIIGASTLNEVTKLKKKLVFKRQEPLLVNVLGNYSSDEDDY